MSGEMATGPQSNLSAPASFSSSDLVFNDNFSGTTLDKDWHAPLEISVLNKS
jgi:hypothetical protein